MMAIFSNFAASCPSCNAHYHNHTVDMDRASQVLAQPLPPNVPRTYAVLSERSNVPISTLCHRKHGRRSKEALARSRQYLTPEEVKALIKFVLLMSSLGHPVRIKFIRSLAFRIALRRSANRPLKPPPACPSGHKKLGTDRKLSATGDQSWPLTTYALILHIWLYWWKSPAR